MDIIIPAIRQAAEHMADDIAYMKMPDYDAYKMAFRPKVRAFLTITGPFLYGLEPEDVLKSILTRMEQVKAGCELAIKEVFDEPQEDIEIEFSMGAEPPQSTI
jgi:hypothetical protein